MSISKVVILGFVLSGCSDVVSYAIIVKPDEDSGIGGNDSDIGGNDSDIEAADGDADFSSDVSAQDVLIPDTEPLPCLQACSPSSWNNVGPVTSGNASAEGAMSVCARFGGGAVVVLKDGDDARLRLLNTERELVIDTILPITLMDESESSDVGNLICLQDRFVLIYRNSAQQVSLVTFDASGALVDGPILVSQEAESLSYAPKMAQLGSELYVFFAQLGDTTDNMYARRFDISLAPLGDMVALASGLAPLPNRGAVTARDEDVAYVFLNSETYTFYMTSLSGDRRGPTVELDIESPSPFMDVDMLWTSETTVLCWAHVGDGSSTYNTLCAMLDGSGALLEPVGVVPTGGRYDGLAIGLVAGGCAVHLMTYCRDFLGNCSIGGNHLVLDPDNMTWESTNLPVREGRNIVGYIPQSADTIIHGSDLWHFGLVRSNGAGTTQLQDLYLTCE